MPLILVLESEFISHHIMQTMHNINKLNLYNGSGRPPDRKLTSKLVAYMKYKSCMLFTSICFSVLICLCFGPFTRTLRVAVRCAGNNATRNARRMRERPLCRAQIKNLLTFLLCPYPWRTFWNSVDPSLCPSQGAPA